MDKSETGSEERVRVDVWTWAVRLFKTRSLAAAACKNARLLVNGERCRPAKKIGVGDEIQVKRGVLTRTVEVKGPLQKRVGASRVDDFLIDRTPPEEYERAAEVARATRETTVQREAGAGRPTKKDRRDLDELMEDAAEEKEAFERLLKSFSRGR
ncbi:MAG: S4 domain-containing protein [Verrucomicrobiales bacterium]